MPLIRICQDPFDPGTNNRYGWRWAGLLPHHCRDGQGLQEAHFSL